VLITFISKLIRRPFFRILNLVGTRHQCPGNTNSHVLYARVASIVKLIGPSFRVQFCVLIRGSMLRR
jgi:hypothetical protein